MSENRPQRPPLRLAGIVFALALNLFLVSVVFLTAGSWGVEGSLLIAALLTVAVAAGVLTTLYVGARSGIHAFIGGLLSVPFIGFFVVPNNWGFALLAGSFCALGGIAGEFFHRRRQ